MIWPREVTKETVSPRKKCTQLRYSAIRLSELENSIAWLIVNNSWSIVDNYHAIEIEQSNLNKSTSHLNIYLQKHRQWVGNHTLGFSCNFYNSIDSEQRSKPDNGIRRKTLSFLDFSYIEVGPASWEISGFSRAEYAEIIPKRNRPRIKSVTARLTQSKVSWYDLTLLLIENTKQIMEFAVQCDWIMVHKIWNGDICDSGDRCFLRKQQRENVTGCSVCVSTS